MKPLVYVAGPISSDPIHNTREAIARYTRLIGDDVVIPFCPHLSVLVEITNGHAVTYEQWLRHDFDMIARADALLRTKGASPGADREVEYARKLNIPVFTTQSELYEWVDAENQATFDVIQNGFANPVVIEGEDGGW
jgi:hypothetical protein